MKVLMVTPWKFQWIEGYKRVFDDMSISPRYVDSNQDITMFMWCDSETINHINNKPKKSKYIVFARRYELFYSDLASVNWGNVEEVILVNDFLAKVFQQITGVIPKVVYNGVTTDKWTFSNHGHGKRVAVVGYINQKKNLPLAVQIAAQARKELHLAGGLQDTATLCYIDILCRAMGVPLYVHGAIDPEKMDEWLEDKDYILSCAISEGCPNNVIEAMAKGIKPVVHNWPGAREQFGEFVFNSVGEAVAMMTAGPISAEYPISIRNYDSQKYRAIVEEKFGNKNYITVRKIAESLWTEKTGGGGR